MDEIYGMLSALLALPASAQKITTQHEVVDCGQVGCSTSLSNCRIRAEELRRAQAVGYQQCIEKLRLYGGRLSEDEHKLRRKFRHQGGIRCQADGYFHQAGVASIPMRMKSRSSSL